MIDSENNYQNLPNPRSSQLIEQDQQYFGIFIPRASVLFSSNKKLNTSLQLKHKESFSSSTMSISPAVVSEQEINEKLRSVKKIELKYKNSKIPDLFGISTKKP
ncbi:hypothetical protein V3564_00185 [Bartonella sp. B12(2025)]